MIAEIVGPNGTVHFRRPVGDKLVDEARSAPGYTVRIVPENSYAIPFGFRWRSSRGDTVHRKLKRSIERPTKRYLWVPEDEIEFAPALSPRIYGDGRALVHISTVHQRPAFYVIRIDSSWDIAGDGVRPKPEIDFCEFVDDIRDGLEAEFGPRFSYDNEEREGDGDPWPAFDDRDGVSWCRVKWPKLKSLSFIEDPYSWRSNLLCDDL